MEAPKESTQLVAQKWSAYAGPVLILPSVPLNSVGIEGATLLDSTTGKLWQKIENTWTDSGTTVTLSSGGGTLPIANGGTGATTASGARSNLGAAASGANSDILSLSGLTGTVGTPTALQFSTASALTAATGQFTWNDSVGTIDLGMKGGNVQQHVGQQLISRVTNDDTVTLDVGAVVYVSGSVGSKITVKRAQADADLTSATVLGVVMESIAVNNQGFVATYGNIPGVNTFGLTEGAALYLSPTTPGGFTTTKTVAPNHLVLIGYVVRASATVGEIFVHTQNGYELDELHDVKITSVATGNILVYDGTVPAWINYASGTSGYSLVSNGLLTKPTWQQISLTTGVTGILPTANGGTNLSTFTAANNAIYSTSASTLTAGTLPVAAGGTGQTSYTDGQLLIGNTTGNTLAKSTLTAGTGISVTNGSGSITIARTGSALISSGNANSGTTVTITGAAGANIPDTYSYLTLQLTAISFTANISMILRISTDGSTYDSTAGNYHGIYTSVDGTPTVTTVAITTANVLGGFSNGAGSDNTDYTITFSPYQGGTYTQWVLTAYNNVGAITYTGSGFYKSTTSLKKIQLSGGTFDGAGTYALYGA
jgi:hypothetical protein